MSFLPSFGVILLCGLLLGSICKKIKLPPLLGMLIVGIVLGPYVLNLIAPQILSISSDLRQMALIIVLTRAGLSFNFKELKENGRSAILLCFVPAMVEIMGYIVLGILLLKLNWNEAAILGCVMAAVSPAVVVPRMLKIKEEGYGTKKGIPQMILAGASADDIAVIILFTAFLGMSGSDKFDFNVLWQTPVAIMLGIGIGGLIGWIFTCFLKKFAVRDTVKVVILLSLSFLLVGLEQWVDSYVPFSGLLAIIAMSVMLNQKHEESAKMLSNRYQKLWVVAEIVLFVLVGATLDFSVVLQSGAMLVAVIVLALLLRMIGVLLCTIPSKLNWKERLFCMIAYTPKATVQASIGGIPLAMGLACGSLVLTAAVLSILITAPVGSFLTDLLYQKLLKQEDKCSI